MALSARKCVFCALAIFVARLDRGGVHSYRWLVDGPFPLLSSAPAFSVSFSTSKMFGVVSASDREREGVRARLTRLRRDGRRPTAKKFRLLRARIGEKNGSEAETQRLCRREKRGLLLPSPITHPKVLSPRSNPNVEDEEGAWELRVAELESRIQAAG